MPGYWTPVMTPASQNWTTTNKNLIWIITTRRHTRRIPVNSNAGTHETWIATFT